MIPLLAAATEADPAVTIGLVVVGLTALLNLGLTAKQLLGGNKGERQIEPTQLAAIRLELGAQTGTLNKLDREMGEVKASVKAVDDKITAQAGEVENAFKRINAISIESAGVKARLDDHMADHRENRRHA